MPYLIDGGYRKPYSRPAGLCDWWPKDTQEWLVKRSEFAKILSEGLCEANAADPPGTLALDGILNLKPFFKSVNGWWFVEQVIKDLIEALDPGRHQFVPIRLAGYGGTREVEDGTWYILNVHFRVTSVVDELSDVRPSYGFKEIREKMLFVQNAERLTMDAAKLDPAAHLWREHRYGRELFMSEVLYDRLVQMKVKLLVRKVDLINEIENK